MRLRPIRTSLLVALAACGAPTQVLPGTAEGPSLEVATTVIAPGAALEVLQSNETADAYGYPVPCNWAIERQDGTIWRTVVDARSGGCVQVVYSMAAGASETRRFQAPMEEGTYRVRMYWNGPAASTQTLSNTFVVSAAADVVVQPLQVLVDAGTEMQFRFTNLVNVPWGYNTCSGGRMQVLVNERWNDLPESLALCTAALDQLAARGERVVTVFVPVGTTAGTYRFTQRFDRTGAAIRAASTIFLVR